MPRPRAFTYFLCLAAVLALTFPPGPYSTAAVQPGGVRLELLRAPVWRKPEQPLSIRLRVTNRQPDRIEAFRLAVGVEDRIGSRSALHESFEQPSSYQPSTFPKDYEEPLAPGETRVIPIRDSTSKLDLLDLASDGGVYPLTITFQDLSRDDIETLGSLTIPLVYYPNDPQATLKLSVLVPLNDLPGRDSDGVFRPGLSGEGIALENALSDSGWLHGLLGAMTSAARSGLELGVAPTPRMIEEIDDMSDGYERELEGERVAVGRNDSRAQAAGRFLQELQALLRSRSVQGIVTPYAFPDLPALSSHYDIFGEQQASRQVKVGQQALEEVLGLRFDGSWLFPAAGRLDAATVEGLSLAGVTRVFASEDSLEPASDPARAGCPEASPSFTCPVRIPTEVDSLRGFVSDEGLQDRFAALAEAGDERLDLQRLFAETAMIREEAPGLAGRVMQATMPSLWHPSPRLSSALLEGLAGAPWLKTITPRRGLRVAPAKTRRVVDIIETVEGEPGDDYWDEIDAADELIEHFGSIDPPDGLFQRLQRSVLVAQSRTWWVDEPSLLKGRQYALSAAGEASGELDKIRIIGTDEIILSSRRAPIQFVLSNDTGYPVLLAVRIPPGKLSVDRPSFRKIFEPGGEAVQLEATTQTSGSFTMNAEIYTPELSSDRLAIDQKTITVRSTQFNKIALGITIGAFAFLVVFYALRALRARRST